MSFNLLHDIQLKEEKLLLRLLRTFQKREEVLKAALGKDLRQKPSKEEAPQEVELASRLREEELEKLEQALAEKKRELERLKREEKDLQRVLEEKKREACEEGKKLGRREGQQEVLKRLDEKEAEFEKLSEGLRSQSLELEKELRAQFEQLLLSQFEALAEVVRAVSERVLREELQQPQKLFPLVREALKKVSGEEVVKISLPAGWHHFFEEQRAELQKLLLSTKELLLAEDASLKEGDFLLETPREVVDGRVEAQVAELARDLP